MTEKQLHILQAAEQLFASNGYHATSTSKVAKAAGVSEGLIFRHFGNKEGLLKAIMDRGAELLQSYFTSIVFEEDPRKMIRMTIELPFEVVPEHADMWQLQYKLKWETGQFNQQKYDPLILALTQSFQKLGYDQPSTEAFMLVAQMEAVGEKLLFGVIDDSEQLQSFLLKKYT